jgi:hypothetical protein
VVSYSPIANVSNVPSNSSPAAVSNALVSLPAAGSNDNPGIPDPWNSRGSPWNDQWHSSSWANNDESEEDLLKEIPFNRPAWVKLPAPCLYADKECPEGTQATFFAYYKSRGHRKNEVLCRACALSHRSELSHLMKIYK